MRVLVADSFDSSGLDALAKAGCTVTYRPQAKDQALVNEVAAAAPDVLIVRSTKVPEAVLAAGPLKLVVRAGAGYNTIDVAAASRLGIYVSNCPGKNSIAVAELAFALIAALDRRIADASERMQLLDNYRKRTKQNLDIVLELTQTLPPPAWIMTLQIDPKTVTIQGETEQADGLLKKLDGLPRFSGSEFTMPLARTGTGEIFRIRTQRKGEGQ